MKVQVNGHMFDFHVFWPGSQNRLHLKMPFKRKMKSSYRRRKGRKTSMKRSFKRSKRGDKRGRHSRQMGGMLKWSGQNFIPQKFMTKHPYMYREDSSVAAQNVNIQWLLLDIAHPKAGGGDILPRGTANMSILYQLWQVLGISWRLTYINQANTNTEVTVFPFCNTSADNVYNDIREMPFAKRGFAMQANQANGTARVDLSGYMKISDLDGQKNHMNNPSYQGTGLSVGGGPTKDYRLNVVFNSASATNTDWVIELFITYYVNWSCPIQIQGVAVTTDASTRVMPYAPTDFVHEDMRRLHEHRVQHRLLERLLDEEMEEKKEEEMMELESSPPSSVPGSLTQNIGKIGFKTPRRIIPQYIGNSLKR